MPRFNQIMIPVFIILLLIWVMMIFDLGKLNDFFSSILMSLH